MRAGVRSILAGHRQATGLPKQVPTIADVLKPLGYKTAMFGKWHLGVSEESRPHHHGFDEWYGFLAGCIDFYSHIFYWGQGGGTNPVHDLWDNNKEVWDNGRYFTEMVTERAVDYIDRVASDDADEPFFLFVGYNAPHYPMHAPQKYLDRFPDLPWDRQIMAAMLSAVDDGVGDVMNALERHGIRDNTCVFFQSDNGPSRETRNWLDGTPDPYYGGTTGKLKGHKFSLYEGGIRVPGLISWPERIPSGQVIDEPAAAMDILPTLLKSAGGDPSEYELDGLDIMPTLTDGTPTPHESIYWEMKEQIAVRKGKWKLVLGGRIVEGAPVEDEVHLSDLDADMGERKNLKDEYPEITAELEASAKKWREDIATYWVENYEKSDTGLTAHPT